MCNFWLRIVNQLKASFTIVIFDHHILKVQVTRCLGSLTQWIVSCNKATEETFWCPQTFIVRFLIISTSATTGFYSRTERRGNRHVAVETERERAWGCVRCEKTRLASIEKGRLEMLVCELLFTTLFIQITRRGREKEEEERS